MIHSCHILHMKKKCKTIKQSSPSLTFSQNLDSPPAKTSYIIKETFFFGLDEYTNVIQAYTNQKNSPSNPPPAKKHSPQYSMEPVPTCPLLLLSDVVKQTCLIQVPTWGYTTGETKQLQYYYYYFLFYLYFYVLL